jgi:hypothetical protein
MENPRGSGIGEPHTPGASAGGAPYPAVGAVSWLTILGAMPGAVTRTTMC